MAKTIGTDVNQVSITLLDQINGQDKARELLKINLNAFFTNRANNTSSSFGPVLLVGPSGVGKSLICKAIHHELGNLKLIEVNGEMLNDISEITSVLLNACDNTTIFIDECQGLNIKSQNLLLTAISEKKLYIPKIKSKNKTTSIPLSNFTLILASTHEYQLSDALRNRMRIYCRLTYYSLDSLVSIVKQRADALGWRYESLEVLHEIAKRAKQTPRLALNRNLQMAKNVSLVNGNDVITTEDTIKAFELLNLDSIGLDELDQAYLSLLYQHNTMKLNILASKLGLPSQTIQSVIESYLLRQDLIEKIGSERHITGNGIKHIEMNGDPNE